MKINEKECSGIWVTDVKGNLVVSVTDGGVIKKDCEVIFVPSKLKEPRERLEEALLTFIERTIKEPSQESDVKIITAIAHELIELWKS